METYELSGETRYRILKKYFYQAISKQDAINQFKKEKGNSIKNIKAVLIK